MDPAADTSNTSNHEAFQPADPTAGPSTITLDSPNMGSWSDQQPAIPAPTSAPRLNFTFNKSAQPQADSTSGRGRGRGRGRGSRGRGSRGRVGTRPQSARASGRLSARTEAGSSRIQKLRFSVKGAGNDEASAGRKSSFLGEYDRDLDDDDEPLAFEEQFILRVPRSLADGPNGLREAVKGKGKGIEGIEFKFMDPRRGTFRINGTTYSSKLVDLPCIIESQKTFDSRHLFKIADISQMLVVEHPIKDESSVTSTPLRVDDYIWPHGLTPPLRHVRKRRFRKRLSRRAIEVVEEQVEELLKHDAEADATSFDLIDAHYDPDIPDSYYAEYDPNAQWAHHEAGSEYGGSEMYEDPGSVAMSAAEDWEGGEGDYGEAGEGDGSYAYGDDDGEGEDNDEQGLDEELAAALMEEMEGDSASGTEDDGLSASEDDDDEEIAEVEDDEETMEKKDKIKQLTSEVKALESAIEKKKASFTGGNPIMMKRFEETIAGLQGEIRTKVEARQSLLDELAEAEEEKKEMDATGQSPSRIDNSTPLPDMDVDDVDEYDTAPPTPLRGGPTESRGSLAEAPTEAEDAEAEDDTDDLFGDDDESVASGTEGGSARSHPSPAGDHDRDTSLADSYGDLPGIEPESEEDEMAAMINASLGIDAGGIHDDFSAGQTYDQGMDEADPTATLEDMANLDDLTFSGSQQDSQYAQGGYDFGVEGGVGMRRLASGLPEDDDEDDSSVDSDD